MAPTPGYGDWQRMRVLVSRLRNQLWDASRQMDLVRRTFPKDRTVGRASKDVSAALHGSYLVMEWWKEFNDGPFFQAPDEASSTQD